MRAYVGVGVGDGLPLGCAVGEALELGRGVGVAVGAGLGVSAPGPPPDGNIAGMPPFVLHAESAAQSARAANAEKSAFNMAHIGYT